MIWNALLRKGHETIAVILNLIFGIGWNIEFIAALIIASSDLYIDYEDAVDNRVDYEEIFIEIKKIYTYYKKNDFSDLSHLTDRLIVLNWPVNHG